MVKTACCTDDFSNEYWVQ